MACHLTTVLIQKFIVLDAAQHHVAGKHRRAAQTHCQSPFAVEGDHQGDVRHLLRLVRQGDLVLCQSAGEEQSAHFIVVHHFAQEVAIGLVLLRGNGIDE